MTVRFYLLLCMSLLHQPPDFTSMLANYSNLHSFFRLKEFVELLNNIHILAQNPLLVAFNEVTQFLVSAYYYDYYYYYYYYYISVVISSIWIHVRIRLLLKNNNNYYYYCYLGLKSGLPISINVNKTRKHFSRNIHDARKCRKCFPVFSVSAFVFKMQIMLTLHGREFLTKSEHASTCKNLVSTSKRALSAELTSNNFPFFTKDLNFTTPWAPKSSTRPPLSPLRKHLRRFSVITTKSFHTNVFKF